MDALLSLCLPSCLYICLTALLYVSLSAFMLLWLPVHLPALRVSACRTCTSACVPLHQYPASLYFCVFACTSARPSAHLPFSCLCDFLCASWCVYLPSCSSACLLYCLHICHAASMYVCLSAGFNFAKSHGIRINYLSKFKIL